MKAKVIPTLLARLDLDRIFAYFVAQQRQDIVERFNDAFEETMAFLSDFPEAGFPLDSDRPRLANIRIKPV